MKRRHFLFSLPALSPLARALEPLARSGPARLLPSLAAYSFRETFQKEPQRLDMTRFVDYCAEQGLSGAEVTSYYFPPDAPDAFFLALRRHAFLRGISLSGTAVGNNFALPPGEKRQAEIDSVKRWIDRAALMGAPHLRIFAGAPPAGFDPAEAMKRCIEAIEECAVHAARLGVFLGVENHGGLVAEPEALVEIMRQLRNPWVGVNLDTGNFHTPDPYAALEACLPWAVNVQLKVEMRPAGRPPEPVDYDRIGRMLRHHCYQGFVALEYEAQEDPWAAVPRHLEKLRALCRS